jgi:hypothetical protein
MLQLPRAVFFRWFVHEANRVPIVQLDGQVLIMYSFS